MGFDFGSKKTHLAVMTVCVRHLTAESYVQAIQMGFDFNNKLIHLALVTAWALILAGNAHGL